MPRAAGQHLISVVSPMFNEEAGAQLFLDALTDVLDDTPGFDWEVLIVDDGSSDRTAQIVTATTERDPRIRLVSLSRNFGHQAAITAGMDQARGDAVIIMDSDLQDPPALIPAMLTRWLDGTDVVYAVRARRDGESPVKKVTAAAYYRFLNWLSEIKIPVDTGDFRLLDRQVVDALAAMPESNRYMRGLVTWVGFKQEPILFDRASRAAGETKYSIRKMLRLAVTGVVSFSDKPLLFPLYAAAGFVLLALAGLAAVLHGADGNWGPGVFSLVAVLGAVQLGSLGVLGVYVGRLLVESRRRPTYIIRSPRAR